jgi:hypothetical protein
MAARIQGGEIMGASKTICYCASRKCKSLAQHLGDGDHLRKNLEAYLREPVCVPGITENDLVIDPYVETIARAGVLAAVARAASFRGADAAHALECQSILARSTGLILDHAYALAVGDTSGNANGVVPVELMDWLGYEELADKMPELGSLLEKSLARAFAELAAAARLDDTGSMQHHAALAVDLVAHVLTFANPDETSSEDLLRPATGHHQPVTDD